MTERTKDFLLREKKKAIEEKNFHFAHEINCQLCQEFCDVLAVCVCEVNCDSDDCLNDLEQTIEMAYDNYLLVKCQYKFLKNLIDGKRKARFCLKFMDGTA